MCVQPPMFPFCIHGGPAAGSAADVSFLNARPAGADGFVRVEQGQFVTDKGVVRFSGVNLTGPANFPSHDDASNLADALSRYGINGVRLHFADVAGDYSNFMLSGEPCLVEEGSTVECFEFNSVQLDKFEFLVSELKKRGVYVDLNLHVGRFHNRLGARKGATLYDEALIASQKEYARRLLNHVNPYTGLAWKDDAALAIVEIANEDSIFRPWGPEFAWVKGADEPFKKFLLKVEKSFYAEMRRFLVEDVGVKCAIAGSQLCASPFEVQQMFDVTIDNRYWCHPHNAGSPEWSFVDAPLADFANGAGDPLALMAKEKMPDRAFVVTEYGHPYPNSFGCETLPLLGAAATVGGWSGIFAYSFAHRAAPLPEYVPFFFTIGERADVLCHQPAVSVMFRTLGGMPRDSFVLECGNPGEGYALFASPEVKFFSGWTDGRCFDLGDGIALSFKGQENAFATVSLLRREGGWLVAATSSGKNTGTRLTEVGRTPENYPVLAGRGGNWGNAPILYAGVEAELSVGCGKGPVSCHALNGNGLERAEVCVRRTGAGAVTIRLAPSCRTLWYLIRLA